MNPLETVADAEHLDALEAAPDRGGGDDTVDAWRRPAGDENREPSLVTHADTLKNVRIKNIRFGRCGFAAEPNERSWHPGCVTRAPGG